MRATGAISLAVGGLCALEAGAEVCGSRPVRTIGGCNNVEMAVMVSHRGENKACPYHSDPTRSDHAIVMLYSGCHL